MKSSVMEMIEEDEKVITSKLMKKTGLSRRLDMVMENRIGILKQAII